MNEYITFGLLVFTSFFSLINPIGAMPVFLGLTKELSHKDRSAILRRAMVASFLIILGFAFSGNLLFRFFNISVDSFKIVGGAIFFVMGFDMLNARLTGFKVKAEELNEFVRDISITPLAIPILCGPGAITNAIVLMEEAGSIEKKLIFVGVLLALMLLNFVILASSSRFVKVLGETGINVMMRLMGLIVMVIAVEFFLAGLRPFVSSFMTP